MPDVAYQALAELWEAVFGEQPSIVAEPGLTAQVLVSCLPPAEPYGFAGEDEGEG
ncbi:MULTISPECIES: hypothetical protein [unclassified Caulobacter]|uniref:hypothetical protein n=1 Tax=unclassified Caulobacter TaxID=2648921 RepID=UPI000A9C6A76|nr:MULTISPECIES: hypothetical protein [unclassified Caulobacter]